MSTNPAERKRSPLYELNESGRRVLSFAQEEAQRFNHNYIGTEHVLLGLLREPTTQPIIEETGVTLVKARSAIEFIMGRGDRLVMGEIGLTPRARKAIEGSIERYQTEGRSGVEADDILGAMADMPDAGIASSIFESLGTNFKRLKDAREKLKNLPQTKPQVDTSEESVELSLSEQLEDAIEVLSSLVEDPQIPDSAKKSVIQLVFNAVDLAVESRKTNQNSAQS